MKIAAEKVVLPDERAGLRIGAATLTIRGHALQHVEDGIAPDAELLQGLLCPAFVNPHTHLSMSAFRGIGGLAAMRGNVVEELYYRLESGLTAEDVDAFARLAIADTLLAGVGTVWDHYYFGESIAEACLDHGLTAVVAPTLQDLHGPGTGQLEQQLETTLDLGGSIRHREAGVVAALGPHATDTVSEPLWNRIADLASRHDLPFHLHAAQSREEHGRAMERHGTTPLRWLHANGWLDAAPSTLLVHVLYADRAEIAALDPDRVALGYCPGSQIQYCFPAYTEGWRELGRRIVIGTDTGACNDTMNVQQELRLAAGGPLFGVVRDGAFQDFWQGQPDRIDAIAARRRTLLAGAEWTPSSLLQTVWEAPGTLHPHLRVGAIRPGFRANLLQIDLNHPNLWPATDPLRALVLQDVAPAIQRMLLNGHWLSAHGEHQRTVLSDPRLADARLRAEAGLRRLTQSTMP